MEKLNEIVEKTIKNIKDNKVRWLLTIIVVFFVLNSCSPSKPVEKVEDEIKEPVKVEEKVEKVKEEVVVKEVDPQSKEKQAYSNFMGDKFSKLSGEMTTFSSLMTNPNFYDDTWILNTAMSLYTIDTIADEVISYSPVPPDFQQLNDVTKEAMMEYKAMVEILPSAIDNLNVDGINRATEHLLIGNELINQVTVLTQELT